MRALENVLLLLVLLTRSHGQEAPTGKELLLPFSAVVSPSASAEVENRVPPLQRLTRRTTFHATGSGEDGRVRIPRTPQNSNYLAVGGDMSLITRATSAVIRDGELLDVRERSVRLRPSTESAELEVAPSFSTSTEDVLMASFSEASSTMVFYLNYLVTFLLVTERNCITQVLSVCNLQPSKTKNLTT